MNVIARLATFSVNGSTKYGLVAENGIVDLSARHAKDYPTLREVIAAGALPRLAGEGARHSPDVALDAVTSQPPIPAPEKIICIGVNYPDRNAEYKDGQHPRQRRIAPGRPHQPVDFRFPLPDQLHLDLHDADARRCHRHGNADGCRRAVRSAALPETLGMWSRSKPKASACCAMA
jgi:hypothetical protein